MLERPETTTESSRSPKPGRWFAPPRPLRPTQKKLPELLQAMVWMPVMVYQVGRIVRYKTPEWVFYILAFGIVALIVAAIVWRVLESIALRATSEDRAFSDAPPGLVEYPVEITVHNAAGPLGVDRGFVWFENGILTFDGRSCSFVLKSRDLYRRNEKGGRKLYHKLPGDALRLRIPGEFAYVRIAPVSQANPFVFGYQLGRFLASVSTSNRPRQWPPLTRYASASESGTPVLTIQTDEVAAPRSGGGLAIVPDGPYSP